MGWLQKSENNNPWGKKPDKQNPPDLEKAIKNFLGGKKNKKNDSGHNNSGNPSNINLPELKWLIPFFIIIAIIIWALSGIFVVKPPEKAVVLKFGQYTKTLGPGMHWYPRFIESIIEVNVSKVDTVTLDKEMLTSKENIVHVSFAVQYHVGNVKNYLFNTVNPTELLSQALDSSVRQIIGQSELQNILTIDRKQITDKVQSELTSLLSKYQSGIEINEVLMQPARPPEAVKSAFDDVIKAREDREKLQNEAKSYANRIVPISKGQAKRTLDEAQAYKQRLILQATGDVAQFNALLPIYEKSPEIVENQLYFKTMEQVLAKNKVFLVEGDGNTNLFYWQDGIKQINDNNKQSNSHNSTETGVAPVPYQKITPSNTNLNTKKNQVQYMRWLEANQ